MSQRVNIQQGQGKLIFIDDMGWRLACHDVTKDTLFFRRGKSPSKLKS